MAEDNYKRLRIRGHKLIRSYQGARDGCVNGYCECGKWTFRGWTGQTLRVVAAHNRHLEEVKAARAPPPD